VLRLTTAYFIALIIPEVIQYFIGSPEVIIIEGADENVPLVISLFGVSLIVEMAFYTLSVGVVSYAYKSLVLDDATA